MSIAKRALNYISTIEAVSGQGGHIATFKVAAALRNDFALSVEEALPIMLHWNQHSARPPWTPQEIERKLRSIDSVERIRPRGFLLDEHEMKARGLERETMANYSRRKRPRWPSCNIDAVIELMKTDLVTLQDFRASSPIAQTQVGRANDIIDYLFCGGDDPDPFLCLGKNTFKSVAGSRDNLRSRLTTETWELIVPNPLLGYGSETAIGTISPRAKTNIKERRFIVIECDFDPQQHPQVFRYLNECNLSVQDLCTTILFQLSKTAQLAMAVNSGNKSIHGWFPVQGATRRVQYEFFQDACRLGADPHMARPNQWTRFPNGFRDGNKAKQAVEFLSDDSFIVDY